MEFYLCWNITQFYYILLCLVGQVGIELGFFVYVF